MSIWDRITRKRKPFTLVANIDGGKVMLVADACTDFVVEQGLNITEHPVEAGGNVSDHSEIRLKKVTARIMVTEAPLTIYSGLSSIALGAVASKAGKVAGALTTMVGGYMTDNLLGVGLARIKKSKEIIDILVQNKALINITYKNASISNLVIESVSYPESLDFGNSLVVDLSFKEIRLVGTKDSSVLDKGTIQAKDVNTDTTKELNKKVRL